MQRVKASRRIWLCQLFYLLFSLVWFAFAALTTMLLKHPSLLESILDTALIAVIWLYPLVALFSIVVSWVNFRKGRFRFARRMILIPLLWVVPILSVSVYAIWG
jgi:hypothetical protein